MSVEAIARIVEIGIHYIQYKKFTYLRVVHTTINHKELPRHTVDRLILLEIARHFSSAYDRVRKKHKKTWVWTIAIGPFSVKQK